MIQVFTWPDRGPHKHKFLIHVLDEAKYISIKRTFWVKVAITPIATLLSPDVQTIELVPLEGNVTRAPQDASDEAIARRIATNRAIRGALYVQGLLCVWDETYHTPKRKPHRAYCLEPGKNKRGEWLISAFTFHNKSSGRPLSLPGEHRGFAPIDLLPRIVAHAVAQRAIVDLRLALRYSLTLHYGKSNCVDGRKAWTMVHYWPKATGEGEPDDFDMKEWVIRESENPAEVFTAKAKQLLRLE